MSDIKNLSLKDAQEKLGAKQDELAALFKEAKREDGTYDHTKVKSEDVKTSSDFVAAVKQRNAELDELGEHIEELRELDLAEKNLKASQQGRRNFPLSGVGDAPANQAQFKSIGEMCVGTKGFKNWQNGGRGGGVTLQFEEMLPSDFLSSSGAVMTLGQKALMTRAAGYAPESLRLPGIVEAATRPLQLIDIIPMSRTDFAAIKYMEETTRVHAAAEVAEGGAYPESEFVFTERTNPVQKIGDSLPVTDEQLEDVAFMESYIDGRLTYGVRQRLDQQCYIGDGAGSNLRGILNVAGIQTHAKGADPAMDAFYKAMTKVRLVGRAIPTHHVMHPNDWQGIRLTRTADGVYIFGNPTEAGPERLWGLPVTQNDAGAEGTGLVGSFDPSWITLSEKRGIDIQMGYVGTQFTEGKRTMRADMRAALTAFRPAAFCSVTGL
ncbi:MAG: phage major capsid protein [Pseudomonadota bacterium]